MAVRDDFAPGEVLAAADLNDTFASKLPYSYGTATPSTTDSGFLWYDSNSTPAAPKFWDGAAFQNLAPSGGLTLVASESFSAVSSVSINSCFTADYDNYRIVLEAEASGSADFYLRLRASGSDNTASSYVAQRLQAASTTVAAARQTSSYWYLGGINSGGRSALALDIYSPALARNTTLTSHNQLNVSSAYVFITSSQHTVASAFDGVTAYPSSGTYSGSLRIYGYKNS